MAKKTIYQGICDNSECYRTCCRYNPDFIEWFLSSSAGMYESGRQEPCTRQKNRPGFGTVADIYLSEQRSYIDMLRQRDGDVFYSRSDLMMLIDKSRKKALECLMAHYRIHCPHASGCVLHAAAGIDLGAQNLRILIHDYPDSLRKTDATNEGALPLHIASASGKEERVRMILFSYSPAAAILDARGRLPLHAALFCGADVAVIRLLCTAYQNALTLPFLPDASVSEDEFKCIGFLPFHIACVFATPDVIYEFLQIDPSAIIGFHSSNHEKNCSKQH